MSSKVTNKRNIHNIITKKLCIPLRKSVLMFIIVIHTISLPIFDFDKNHNGNNRASAQSAATVSGIVVTLEPPFPIPGSAVKVKMETYQFEMDTADISWYYNNKKIDGGIGKHIIEIKYPNLGETADIRVVATVNSSQNYVGGKRLGGSTVNLLYEPINTHTPIWYHGSPLTAEGGKVKLYAEAYLYSNGKRIDTDNLVYNWTINEEPNTDISGLGKNNAIITLDPILGEAFVQLTVKSLDGIFESKVSTRITGNSPSLKLYYNNNTVLPKYIDYSLTVDRGEIVIIAEPFNSLIDKGNGYLWTINSVPSNNNTNVLTVRRGEKTAGTVSLNVNFENKDRLFQSADFSGIIDYK